MSVSALPGFKPGVGAAAGCEEEWKGFTTVTYNDHVVLISALTTSMLSSLSALSCWGVAGVLEL